MDRRVLETLSSPAQEPGRAVAMADGQAIGLTELAGGLLEVVGAEILREQLLDGLIDRACREAGLSISASQIQGEEAELQRTLAEEAGVTEADGERLLIAVRRNRGLGPERYQRLLERTAKLRALVAADVAPPTEDELRRAYAWRYGPRRAIRAFVHPSAAEAAAVREALLSLPVQDRRTFLAEAAFDRSTDSSAVRGGLLAPVNSQDPDYPAALRAEADRLQVGDVSAMIAVESGFCVLMLEPAADRQESTWTPEYEAVRPTLERAWIRRTQSLAMESWQRRALESLEARGGLVVIDPRLRWSIQARPLTNLASPSNPR